MSNEENLPLLNKHQKDWTRQEKKCKSAIQKAKDELEKEMQ